MVKLMPSVFNPHYFFVEKTLLLVSFTLSFLVAFMILYAPSIAFYITLIFAGLIGLAFSYAYSGHVEVFGGSGFSRDNVGFAILIPGALHLMIILMLLASPSSIAYAHTALPLSFQIPIVFAFPVILVIEYFLVALPEELYFRAFLVDGVSKCTSYTVSVAVAMATWVGLHAITRIPAGAAVALIPITAGGIALTWLYMAIRNTAVVALAHALYNTLIELTALLIAVDVGLALLTLLLGTIAELVVGAGLLVTGPYRAEL
jgi:membrane protease YdiL (CAAX protease family)